MESNLDHILVFKTNITSLCNKNQLQFSLNGNAGILHWNIDHEDVDNVLRVVSETLSHFDIVKLVSLHGFECMELD